MSDIVDMNTLTTILAAVIVVIVVITLIINICVICRSGCWVCKKTANMDLALPLTAIPMEVPEQLLDGSLQPPPPDVGSAQYAVVLPRNQRLNLQGVPVQALVNNGWPDVGYHPIGMTVIEDDEHFISDVDVTINNNVGGHTQDKVQQRVVTTDILKNALYASVLPRSQRMALSRPTCDEPLHEEAEEIDAAKSDDLSHGTICPTSGAKNEPNVGQVPAGPRFIRRQEATSKYYVGTDVVPSNECRYMNTTETQAAATSSPDSHSRLHSNTISSLGRWHCDTPEPLYAEAKEIDTSLMTSTKGRRQPGARDPPAVAAAAANDAAKDAYTGNYYANCSTYNINGFATIV